MIEDILTGNINNVKTDKQWFIGYFMPEPFKSDKYEIKWGVHKKNDEGFNKSQYDTLTILGYGLFEVVFLKSIVKMKEMGDFVYYPKNINHGWLALEDSLVITIRNYEEVKK